MQKEKVTIPNTPLRFVWYVSREHVAYISTVLMILVFVSALDSAQPLFYRYIIDSFATYSQHQNPSMLWKGVGAYIGVVFTSMVLWRVVVVVATPWLTGARAKVREVLTEYLLGHSHTYFEGRFAGSVANKISHAADGVRNLAESATIDFAPVVFGVLFGIGTAFYANFFLGLIFTGWLCVAIPTNIWLSKKRVPYTLASQTTETALRGMTVDIVTNVRSVHEFVSTRMEMEGLAPHILARKIAGIKNQRIGQGIVLINGLLYVAMLGAMLFVTTYLVLHGKASIGTVALVFSLVVSSGEHIFSLGWRLSSMAESWGEIKEGLDDILLPHDVVSAPQSTATLLNNDIRFDAVHFSYGSGTVLRDFSLHIQSGERVGFVGKSGTGKSTLVKLLLRHYDVTGGTIRIGEEAIRNVSLETLRKAVAVIPQESNLFHRTIRENIAYGKQEATDTEVRHAAQLAEADDFISTLPQGYDTLVGERGVKLSGGQRQRVAIARAILKDAPILVLDEATSALDSESEVAIQKALHTLMEGKTVIAIAHRLSTLREMDRIIVLEDGGIAEEGTHDELVAKKGLYARLWEHQAGGFLQEE